jgi:hypothetical protein
MSEKDLNVLKLALTDDDFANGLGELIATNLNIKPIFVSEHGKRMYETSRGSKSAMGLSRVLIELLSSISTFKVD